MGLFLFGNVANQIVMREASTFATNDLSPTDLLAQRARDVQTQMILRLMIGSLNEGYRAIQTRFISSPLAKTHRALLDAGGEKALTDLNRQFSQSILQQLRTEFAFHHPKSDAIESAFDQAADDPNMDAEWNWYLSQHSFNNLFHFSDVVITHAIFEEIGETDWRAGQQKIMDEVTRASNNIKEFVLSFIKAVWLKHFGTELIADKVFDLKGAPDVNSVHIPFFVTVPGLQQLWDGMPFR